MAKYTIRIQHSNRDDTEYKTDDIGQANSRVKREMEEAQRPTSNIQAIFVNDTLKWKKTK